MIRSTGLPATTLLDLSPSRDDFRAAVCQGLRRARKKLPCKFLYDARGSELFEAICELDEYYLTRTELEIMRGYAGEMADAAGRDCLLIELGSGSSLKTRLLLDRLEAPAAYVPVDISSSALAAACEQMQSERPGLEILPVCADYTRALRLPTSTRAARKRVVYFPGSTLGNFSPRERGRFFRQVRQLVGVGGGLLLGVDLKKNPRVLHAAYNDREQVTADFNQNLLVRINRELGGTFAREQFAHYAPYNARLGRMEMHLVSLEQQTVLTAGQRFSFSAGESIFTECCYKFSVEELAQQLQGDGLEVRQVWTDSQAWFAVLYCAAV